MNTCKDCIHYEPCKNWAEDMFPTSNSFPYDEPKNWCVDYKATADVVEVVRCKDCAYCDGGEDSCGNIYCILHDGRFDKNGYCSYGKKEIY